MKQGVKFKEINSFNTMQSQYEIRETDKKYIVEMIYTLLHLLKFMKKLPFVCYK